MDLAIRILYALPVYQSFVLAFFLFAGSRRTEGYSRQILGTFQLLMGVYFSFNFLYSVRAFAILEPLYFLVLPVILLFIPVFYLYVLSITQTAFRLQLRHFLHFLPAGLVALANLPYLLAPTSDRLSFVMHGYSSSGENRLITWLMLVYMTGILVIFTLQLLWYSVKAIRLYRSHRSFLENTYSFTENISLDWIPVMISCFVVFFIFNDILYIVGFRQHYLTQVVYNISMLTLNLVIGYRGLLQKDLSSFSASPASETISESTVFQSDADQDIPANEQSYLSEADTAGDEPESAPAPRKYSGSSLSAQQKLALLDGLNRLMTEEKMFIIESLTIEDVASRLNSNSRYVSQVVNETYNRNFYTYINGFRIDEAKKLLLAEGSSKYSIQGIARTVGFASKSAFNQAFKRITGLTPSEFKESNDGTLDTL
jgi:AraC-like DNA-binding protein